MSDPSPDNNHSADNQCHFIHFGLIVTGKAEREHLPKLFRSLTKSGMCNVKLIGQINQLSPITSQKRKVKMLRSGKTIPNKDAQKIGLPARRYLETGPCRFVILIDDLEHDRLQQTQQLFYRYRLALDTILKSQKRDASVHFLVNMLEAYYFADADAINLALELEPPLEDHDGDVETIRHPKGKLKKRYPSFKEVEDGGKILKLINIEHVLLQPDKCAGLRTLFAWCVKVLERHPSYKHFSLADKYQLGEGKLSDITRAQLDNL
jgi:hypothetical protein